VQDVALCKMWPELLGKEVKKDVGKSVSPGPSTAAIALVVIVEIRDADARVIWSLFSSIFPHQKISNTNTELK
jgi:hypothetical protein